ncbi:unnamed protein product [Vitrella brassicaformis CCMP3155]|uniref:Uncharacterized protein n=2 Tax=Vitrella brassicaformis TaxID=1169539 RepID=A0A0G4EM19_VITBC|nr:unnamed protein product [Vitrella brassicaformis CCMP3155]|eukprot:CEL98183.1 unnamed protein product [Vitrella brassicaformis CCMP3155]
MSARRHAVRLCVRPFGTSPAAAAAEAVPPPPAQGGIYRGFKFDRVADSKAKSPEELIELDQMAMVGMKSFKLTLKIRTIISEMLKRFGHKGDLEEMGKYMQMRLRTRTSAEVPRVLPSNLLPESEQGQSVVDKILSKPGYKELNELLQVAQSLPDESEVKKLAIAHAEDSRHKLYNMTSVSYSPQAALAHTAHRLPKQYAAFFRVLYEVTKRVPDFRPRTLVEYNAQSAPGIIAAHHIWEGGFTDTLAVEPSEHLTQIGKFLTSDFPSVRWQLQLYEVTHTFDLCLVSYALAGIKGQESREMLIKNLWNRINPGGCMVVIEPGTPTGFRFIHGVREIFIKELGDKKFHFVAPCPHEGMCPLAVTGKDWCHFSQRLHKIPHYIYNKGYRCNNIDDEKFSFLVIRKQPGPRVLYKTEDEAPFPALKSYFWPRIIYPSLKRGEHVLIDVCAAPQNFERLAVTKSQSHAFGYRQARTSMWGDLWRYPKRLCRPEARAYIPDETRSHLERKAKKAREALKALDSSQAEEFLKREKSHYGS